MDEYFKNLKDKVNLRELNIDEEKFDEEFAKEKFFKLENGRIINEKEFFVEYRKRYKDFIKALDEAIENYKRSEALNE